MAIIITSKQLEKTTNFGAFIDYNKNVLVGSAVFTKDDSWLSKQIQRATKHKTKQKEFIPSHIGSIVSINGQVYLFNMVPPRASCILLQDFLEDTDDEYRIVLRDFSLKVPEYNQFILHRNGKRYGYFSALQSATRLLKYIPNRKEHCSEIHTKALQEQGLLKGLRADDVTPVELYDLLTHL